MIKLGLPRSCFSVHALSQILHLPQLFISPPFQCDFFSYISINIQAPMLLFTSSCFFNFLHRNTVDPSRSVVPYVELVSSAERVQDSEGRIVNGVEQHILYSSIYKGDASETRSTISILTKAWHVYSHNYHSSMKPWSTVGYQVEESCREVGWLQPHTHVGWGWSHPTSLQLSSTW